jgi:hypothetical protein
VAMGTKSREKRERDRTYRYYGTTEGISPTTKKKNLLFDCDLIALSRWFLFGLQVVQEALIHSLIHSLRLEILHDYDLYIFCFLIKA